MTYCDICQGSKKVRLPRYPEAIASSEITDVDILEPPFKEFSCPQCGENIQLQQVYALQETTETPHEMFDRPGLQDHLRSGLARAIGVRMLQDGYISFEIRANAREAYGRSLTAVIGKVAVVRPDRVGELENRIRQNDDSLSRELATAITLEINNWGSYYGAPTVPKKVAQSLIEDARKHVMKNRERKTNVPMD